MPNILNSLSSTKSIFLIRFPNNMQIMIIAKFEMKRSIALKIEVEANAKSDVALSAFSSDVYTFIDLKTTLPNAKVVIPKKMRYVFISESAFL